MARRSCLALVALLLACTGSAQGQQGNGGHFRFATIFWKYVDTPDKSNTVEITIESAWRRSYSSNYFTAAQTPDATLMQINGKESPILDLGDGKIMYLEQVKITAWSQAEDWFLGVQTFRHTYDTPNKAGEPWVVVFKGCCRMSSLRNNADKAWEMKMHIDTIKASESPRVVSLPVIFFSQPTPGLPTIAGFNLRTAMGYDDVIWSAPIAGVNAPVDFDQLASVVKIGSAGNVTVDVATPGLLHVVAYAHIRAEPSIMVPVDVIVNISAAQNSDPQFDSRTMELFSKVSTARPGFELAVDISGFIKGPITDASMYVGFTVGPLPAGAHLTTVRGKGTRPTEPATMTLKWTPCVDQIGKTVICFDVVNSLGVAGTQSCLIINVIEDTPPTVAISLMGETLGPGGSTRRLFIGVSYVFTIAATDANYMDIVQIMPTAHDGSDCTPPACMPTPPGSVMTPPKSMSTWGGTTMTHMNMTFAPAHNQGGYNMRHCFTAADACGAACGASECPGVKQMTTSCIVIKVERCSYVVRQGQELQEIAAIYHSDWLQLWSLNHGLASPDVGLSPGDIVDIGHLYAVQPYDKPHDVASRFGMTDEAFAIMNADTKLGDVDKEQCTSIEHCNMVRWCILPSSCKGQTGSIYQGAYENQPWFAQVRDGN